MPNSDLSVQLTSIFEKLSKIEDKYKYDMTLAITSYLDTTNKFTSNNSPYFKTNKISIINQVSSLNTPLPIKFKDSLSSVENNNSKSNSSILKTMKKDISNNKDLIDSIHKYAIRDLASLVETSLNSFESFLNIPSNASSIPSKISYLKKNKFINLKNKKNYLELYFIRNLITHDNSIINQKFLDNIKNNNINSTYNQLNSAITFNFDDLQFMLDCFQNIKLMLLNIYIEVINNNPNLDKTKNIELLHSLACIEINKGSQRNFKVAEFICENLIKITNKPTEKILYWISKKNSSGLTAEDKNEINSLNLDNDKFLSEIIINLLLDNYTKLIEDFGDIIKSEKISFTAIILEPLFKQFSESKEWISFITSKNFKPITESKQFKEFEEYAKNATLDNSIENEFLSKCYK